MGTQGDSGSAWSSITVTWLGESSKNKTSHANCPVDAQVVSLERIAKKDHFIFVSSLHVAAA